MFSGFFCGFLFSELMLTVSEPPSCFEEVSGIFKEFRVRAVEGLRSATYTYCEVDRLEYEQAGGWFDPLSGEETSSGSD
jgi:hypothetical protein